MVVVRLARRGSHNRPCYSIVVADSRARLCGRFIEKIGFYNPITSNEYERFEINLEQLNYWIGVGAQPSDTIQRLVKKYTSAKGKNKPQAMPENVSAPAA